jgi:tRNA A-37 threonylcarbamoyl transferase component Bud32
MQAGCISEKIVLGNGTVLLMQEVVRELPGRRLVCRGLWQNRLVYAKLFFGDKAVRDASRDVAGVHALTKAGISTPALLFEGEAADGECKALIFAAVTDGRNAEELLQELSSAARLRLAQRLVAAVASHHHAGLLQQDMYLKNFLVTESQVLTLDGDGIRPLPPLRRRRAALRNLALLLSKFDVEDDVWLPKLFGEYARQRGWSVRDVDAACLISLTAACRKRTAKSYAEKKVFRNCTDVVVTRTFHRFTALVRRYDTAPLRLLLTDPEARFSSAGAHYLKRGNTTTVVSLQLDGREVVVKRYNIKNIWHGLSRACRASRAAASWSNAHRLKMYGIATAEPLALLECRWGWLRRQAYFIAEWVDAPDALRFFGDPDIPVIQKRYAALQIARLLHKLGRLCIVHGDMKASNLKILPDGQPLLLDLDALHETRYARRARRGQVKDIRRLLHNWRDVPETRNMLQDALQQLYQDAELLRQAGVSIQNSEEK